LGFEEGQKRDGTGRGHGIKCVMTGGSRRFLNWHTLDPSPLKGAGVLVDELTTYREHLKELLEREGDYVLIKGRQVIGVFADREQAVDKAVDLFGGEPVLVKKIVAKEPIHMIGGVVL
jgi:hypothetical protein